MDSLVEPIERVVEATEWFARTPALRLLHITTSELLRNTILQHICATELIDANTEPFFVLEAPTEPADDGWGLRADELRADWEALEEGFDAPIEPLWPSQQARTPLARFGLELGRALAVLPRPATGLVIVLAPVWIRDAARWRDDLGALVAERGLAKARFIVVEADTSHSSSIVERLGERAERVDARVDEAALKRDADARLDAMKNAPPGATGPRLVGAAGPPVAPPPRPREQPPMTPEARAEQAQARGVPPIMLDPSAMQELRVLVLSAAASMRDGKAADAVRTEREARDFCVRHDLRREAVVNELVLAGYVLQGGSPERALDLYREARRRAEEAALTDLAVQAQMAAGSCLLVLKRVDDAATAYAEAGQLGANAGAPILAIEAYRMCGQLLASKGRLQEAATAFRRALETGERGGPMCSARPRCPRPRASSRRCAASTGSPNKPSRSRRRPPQPKPSRSKCPNATSSPRADYDGVRDGDSELVLRSRPRH